MRRAQRLKRVFNIDIETCNVPDRKYHLVSTDKIIKFHGVPAIWVRENLGQFRNFTEISHHIDDHFTLLALLFCLDCK